MKITIIPATENDFNDIQQIAYKTWPVAYAEILSKEQLKYMLDLFYSVEALERNLKNDNHIFLLAEEEGTRLGFMAIEHNYKNENITRIHKIYILPEMQGKGIGKLLIDAVEVLARENQSVALSLNVNRFNKALYFYQNLGFEIVTEENIELDHGYLMEDFRMEKQF